MQYSRKLFNDHLIPPRSTVDILYSSARALWKLAVSPAQRDECLSLINSGSINPVVLGIPQTLALYHDMSNPLFSKHDFDSNEFMEGARMGLERYHDIDMQLNNLQMQQTLKAIEECDTPERKRDKLTEMVTNTTIKTSGNVDDGGFIEESNEWKKQAEKDPDSLPGQFMMLVNPSFFEAAYSNIRQIPLNVFLKTFPNFPKLQVLNTEISNTALLSARAQIITPLPLTGEEARNITSEEEAKKNDDILNNIYSESDFEQFPVAAQVEVLYDMHIEHSFPDEDGEDDTKSSSVVQVAVFEGYLHKSPDGNPLRWELATIRPAWEFR